MHKYILLFCFFFLPTLALAITSTPTRIPPATPTPVRYPPYGTPTPTPAPPYSTVIPTWVSPSCIPRPSCLDHEPFCMVVEPQQGWCPRSSPPITPEPVQCTEVKCVTTLEPLNGRSRKVASCRMVPLSTNNLADRSVRYEGMCTYSPFGTVNKPSTFSLIPSLASSPEFQSFPVSPGNYDCSFRICLGGEGSGGYCTPWGRGGNISPTGTPSYTCPPPNMTINCMPSPDNDKISREPYQCTKAYLDWVKTHCDAPPKIVY